MRPPASAPKPPTRTMETQPCDIEVAEMLLEVAVGIEGLDDNLLDCIWQINLGGRGEETWKDLDDDAQQAIYAGLCSGSDTVKHEARGYTYEFNLREQQQRNLRTGKARA